MTRDVSDNFLGQRSCNKSGSTAGAAWAEWCWKPEFLLDSERLIRGWCLNINLLIAAILTLRLASFINFKEERIQQLFHTTTRSMLSAQDPKKKEEEKTTVHAKDECEKVQKKRTILLFKGHSGSGFFEQTSASQDVSLFTNWRNYLTGGRHKCFKQNAKITWRTNATRDWQEN